jgi:hypothetical protein
MLFASYSYNSRGCQAGRCQRPECARPLECELDFVICGRNRLAVCIQHLNWDVRDTARAGLDAQSIRRQA